MAIIKLQNLTKEYSPNVGCFDINIEVEEGQVYGFIGPNGAGKSTVIRQMVGFSKPDQGSGTILGHNIWSKANLIMKNTGYLAGEVNLPNYLKGTDYLKALAKIHGGVDWDYVQKLINHFEFDAKRKIGKMSKGMKQKVAIVSAFMTRPKVLILDEPTSGLDPLMQDKFNQLIAKCKKEGTTVFMSSHIFGELEHNCDRVGFIKKGHLVSQMNLEELQNQSDKIYELKFTTVKGYQDFIERSGTKILKTWPKTRRLQVKIPKTEGQKFLIEIATLKLEQYREIPFSLEEHFLKYYEDEVQFDGQ